MFVLCTLHSDHCQTSHTCLLLDTPEQGQQGGVGDQGVHQVPGAVEHGEPDQRHQHQVGLALEGGGEGEAEDEVGEDGARHAGHHHADQGEEGGLPRELLAVVGSDLGGSDQVVDNLEYWVEIKWSLVQQNVVSG